MSAVVMSSQHARRAAHKLARAGSTAAGSTSRVNAALDRESRRWLEQLRVGHPEHNNTVRNLHDLLRRAAGYELARRRAQLHAVSGPEFEDLAQQAADDSLVKLLERLDEFRGLSRFTTWAYKFVIFEVSDKVARHAWRRQPPAFEELTWDQVPDRLAGRPDDRLDQQAQLRVLSDAIGALSDRQRKVFVAIALNGTPVDVVAEKLDSSPNAIYKNLFDARRSLRMRMAAAGHPVGTGAPCDRS
jgi:RNA polymerase sigma-70 factor, ECF subfamily